MYIQFFAASADSAGSYDVMVVELGDPTPRSPHESLQVPKLPHTRYIYTGFESFFHPKAAVWGPSKAFFQTLNGAYPLLQGLVSSQGGIGSSSSPAHSTCLVSSLLAAAAQ